MRCSVNLLYLLLVSLPLLQVARGQHTPNSHADTTHTTHPHGPVPTMMTSQSTEEALVIPESCKLQADFVFVLDASESVTAEGFEDLKNFVQNVVSNFDVSEDGVRVGVVKYSDTARAEFYLNSYFNNSMVNDSVANIQYTMGQTFTGKALDLVRNTMFTPARGDRPNVTNIAIVITDGLSTDPNDTLRAASETKDAGIYIVSVGVGDETDADELYAIASKNLSENVFAVSNYSELETITERFLISFCPIAEVIPTTTVRTTMYEHPLNESGECTRLYLADIVFVLDSSVSVGADSFEQLKDFVANLVMDMEIGEDNIHVGVMKFSESPRMEFSLNAYFNKSDLNDTIRDITYVMGVTNTDRALTFLRDTMFTEDNGDRPEAPNVAIVVTDGKSSNPNATVFAARQARDANITIFAIGVGAGADMNELRVIASDPDDGHVFSASDYSALASINDTVSTAVFCPEGNVTEATTEATTTTTTTEAPLSTEQPCYDTFPDGCRESGVEICMAYEAWARQHCRYFCQFCAVTYQPETTPVPEICEQADIVFVLDSSVSVSEQGFSQLKDFVINVVAGFDIGEEKVRVGIIKYSDNVTEEFNLIESVNDSDLNGTISGITYEMGITNTGKALDYLMTDMFTAQKGDRPNVVDVAVIITDGESSDPDDTSRAARQAKDAGIILFAIGVGEVDLAELREIASDPDSTHVFTVRDYSVLDSIKSAFEERVCPSGQGTTAPTPAPTASLYTTGPFTGHTIPGGCGDVSPDCGALGLAVCNDYRYWSLYYCRQTCGFCDQPIVPKPECCVDQDGWEMCVDKHLDGCVGIYSAWAQAHCQAYCGYCEPCPITPCVNKNPDCDAFDDNVCTDDAYHLWAFQNCMKKCGLCSNYGYYWQRNNLPAPTTAIMVPRTECQDLLNDCSVYGRDDCDKYDKFMRSYCPLYCGFCSDATQAPGGSTTPTQAIPANCGDVYTNCSSYSPEHCCDIYEPWARAHCAKYCGFCGVVPDRICVDHIDYCDREPADLCTNDRYLLFRQQNCAGFCKICDTPWQPPNCTAKYFTTSAPPPNPFLG